MKTPGAAADEETRAALEQVTRRAQQYARKAGFVLQPDRAQLDYVLEGLARNLASFGRAYCPCREVTGDPNEDRANICPCRGHREEIARAGQCECGLFTRGA